MKIPAVFVHKCPLCDSNKWKEHIRVRDWRGSEEVFELHECQQCGLIVTSPRPADEDLGGYYPPSAYVSHTNKPKGIFDKVYFEVQKRNLADKHKKIGRFLSKGDLLDYGCGAGAFLEFMRERNWTVTGVELDSSAASIASERIGKKVFSPASFQATSNSFDLITLWHVLEHLPNLPERLREFHQWLKPEAYLFLALPNHRSSDARNYGKDWAAWDVPIHLWHFNRDSIGQLAERFGFEWVESFPMPFDAYYVSMISAKNRGETFWPLSGLWQGWKSNRLAKRNLEASSLIYVLKKRP